MSIPYGNLKLRTDGACQMASTGQLSLTEKLQGQPWSWQWSGVSRRVPWGAQVFTTSTFALNKARDPTKGLAERMGSAFILHPYSFDEESAAEAFWSWWQASTCA